MDWRRQGAGADIMKSKLAVLPLLAAIACASVTLGGLPATTSAAMAYQQGGWVRLENRWRSGQVIHVETALTAGAAPAGWHSAMWAIDDLGDGHVRIGSRWREGHYLHIENGRLESGPIQAGWHSAQWVIEPTGDGYVRFRNRWRPEQYIHVQNGRLEAGAAPRGWHSAMWSMRPAG